MVTEIMAGIATQRTSPPGWDFIEPTDRTFMKVRTSANLTRGTLARISVSFFFSSDSSSEEKKNLTESRFSKREPFELRSRGVVLHTIICALL